MHLNGLDSVVCLGAHVDDIEIGCAGTLMDLVARNPQLEVQYVVLSAPGERRQEARASARSLLKSSGKTVVRIADFEESYLPYTGDEVKRYIQGLAGELQPDLVLTHWRGDAHQDHRLVGELTWNAFRNHFILEYEIPKWDGDMGRPNVFVPLSKHLCELKVAHILSAFPSQTGKDWFTSDVFWSLLTLRGMEARSPDGYAEAFHCSKLVLR